MKREKVNYSRKLASGNEADRNQDAMADGNHEPRPNGQPPKVLVVDGGGTRYQIASNRAERQQPFFRNRYCRSRLFLSR
jgi:hexokinase